MRLRIIIAILLILGSLGGMFYWECYGRNEFLSTDVLSAAEDIPAGKIISASDISVVKIPNDVLPQNSVHPEAMSQLIGKVASVDIPAGIQLAASYFHTPIKNFDTNQSVYAIPSYWIWSVSDSLQPGDTVSVYHMPDYAKLGSYKVAFVKGEGGGEISDNGQSVLKRSVAADVGSLEIICTLSEYKKIYASVNATVTNDESDLISQNTLLFVQELSE